MILLALAIGVILIVAATRNSQAALFTALMADAPAFVIWAAALIAVGAIGFVPGLRPVSRGLLALVLTVLILNNWTQIQAGLTAAAADTSTAATDKAAGVTAATAAGASAGAAAGGAGAGIKAGSDLGSAFANLIPSLGLSGAGGDLDAATTSGGTPEGV